MSKLTWLALALAMPLASVSAQTAGTPPAADAAVAEETRVDDGLKRFGYLAGLSDVCVAPDQKVAFEREIMNTNASIARLLGVDRAFLFSSSFGYGTSVKVDTKDCPDILKAYEARMAKQRAAGGKQK